MKIKTNQSIKSILFIITTLIISNIILLSKDIDKSYEIKIFVNESYLKSAQPLMINEFQKGIESLKVPFNWYLVHSNLERFNYLKEENNIKSFKNLLLDTFNNTAIQYNLEDFPVIILLKNDNIIYKTENFVFNNLNEVLNFDKHSKELILDSNIKDIKKMIKSNNIYFIHDGIKNEIYIKEDDISDKIDVSNLLKTKCNYNLFGDISAYDLFLIDDRPFTLLKFNTLEKNAEMFYHELLLDLEKKEIVDLNYDKQSYIIGDINKLCDKYIYTCFHNDYYDETKSDQIKQQPILATISDNDSVVYHSSIKEIEKLINEEFLYLYVLKSFMINNYLLLFEPSLGISLYVQYNCKNTTLEPLKQFDFQNIELTRIIKELKIKEPYSMNLTNDSEYYFEGIKPIGLNNFVLIFRSKEENQDGLLEYILFKYDSNIKFKEKITYVILKNSKSEKVTNTFFISNSNKEILFGIKNENHFKIYNPRE